MPRPLEPLVLINAVGLTSRLLAHAPRLQALAQQGWSRPLIEVLPAVTCTAQATILTGKQPDEHGIVANGWLFRDTGEVRFWQQSNRLLQAEPLYDTLRRHATELDVPFRCAKLFWWFNQGANVEFSVTPKPYYGADGNKAFGISGHPQGLTDELEAELGRFPFHTFWGPMAGKGCTEWIARCTASVIKRFKPELTLAYLPHLDYDPQRYGPDAVDLARLVHELDDACGIIHDEAQRTGARVWVVSEYGHVGVSKPVYVNRVLREAGWLVVRPGPFGEILETFESEAFAVCDHQLAHVYVRKPELIAPVQDRLASVPGVAAAYAGDERATLGLKHERAGEVVLLSQPNAWFAYPFWLDDRQAPDYARTVDIHRKPGFDPCELFFDPELSWPKGRVIRKLMQKKLGFRMLMDVIPLDAGIVRGSHGLLAGQAVDRPILIGSGPSPTDAAIPMTAVRDCLLNALLSA